MTPIFALSLFLSSSGPPIATAGTGKGDVHAGAGVFHLYTMKAGTTAYHRLASIGNAIQPKWSPDGRRVAFAANPGTGYRIYVVKADGSGAQVIAPGPRNSMQPSWSPNGRKLAFASDRSGNFKIYRVNADGSGLRRLTSGSSNDRAPAWSPTGATIAFSSDRDGNFDLFTVKPSGTGLARLTSAPAQDKGPSWSPNGSKLAFSSDREGNFDVYTYTFRNHVLERLTTNKGPDAQAAWSPKGNRIGFASDRGGNVDLYTVRSAGGGTTRATFDSHVERYPAWSPDGSAMLFSSTITARRGVHGAVWGIFSEPRDGKDGQGVVNGLEKKIGRDFTGQRIYVSMDASFPDHADTVVAEQGGVIYHNFNSWHVNDAGQKICYSWADIAAGKYNTMLAAMARQVRAFLARYPRQIIYMSFTHEPTNGSEFHPRCGTAPQYIAAYDRVVQVFKNQHVTRPRVLWTWTNVAAVFNGHQGGPEAWEPHTYDVVGIDGYNHSPGSRTPSQIFGKAEAFAVAHHKKILIGEIGVDEVAGDPLAKGRWYTAVSEMFHGWKNLTAIMWTNTNNGGDYWIDSSAKSLAAFQKAGKDFR